MDVGDLDKRHMDLGDVDVRYVDERRRGRVAAAYSKSGMPGRSCGGAASGLPRRYSWSGPAADGPHGRATRAAALKGKTWTVRTSQHPHEPGGSGFSSSSRRPSS